MFHRENLSQDGKYTDLTFVTWIAFNLPIAIINLIIIWIILGVMHLGIPNFQTPFLNKLNCFKSASNINEDEGFSEEQVRKMLRLKVKELGYTSFHERTVIILFTTAVLLWFSRDPQFIPGWSSWFPDKKIKIGDSSVAILITILMFIIPRKVKYLGCSK